MVAMICRYKTKGMSNVHNRRFLAVFIILLGALGVFVTAAARPILQVGCGLWSIAHRLIGSNRTQPVGRGRSQLCIRTGEGWLFSCSGWFIKFG